MTATHETKPLILSADDEPGICEMIKDVFEDVEYEVITAGDGVQALDLIQERMPDLVLLNIKMPRKSGIEVLHEMTQRYADIAVVMLSAVTDLKIAVEAVRLGAADYLVKPLGVDEVVDSVQRALERRKLLLQNQGYAVYLESQLVQKA